MFSFELTHSAHIVLGETLNGPAMSDKVQGHAMRRRYISAEQQVTELAWSRRKNVDTVK